MTNDSNRKRLHFSRRIQHATTGLFLLLLSYIIPPYPHGSVLLAIATVGFWSVHQRRLKDEEFDAWYISQFGTLLRAHEIGEWERDGNTRGGAKNGERGNHGSDETKDNASITSSWGPLAKDTTATAKRRKRKKLPHLPGAFYFLVGTTFSTVLFRPIVARTALLVLSLADPMAGIVGAWSGGPSWVDILEIISINDRKNTKNEKGREDDCAKFALDSQRGSGPTLAGSLAFVITTIACTYIYFPSRINEINPAITFTLSFQSRLWIGLGTAFGEAIAGRWILFRYVDDNMIIPIVFGNLIVFLGET